MNRLKLTIFLIPLFSLISPSTSYAQSDLPPCQYFHEWTRGDANGDRTVDLSDAISILEYLFTGGEPPVCLEQGDFNNDGSVDISDPIPILNWLFLGGPGPSGSLNFQEVVNAPDVDILFSGIPFDLSDIDTAIKPEMTEKKIATFGLTSQVGDMQNCDIVAFPIDQDNNILPDRPAINIVSTEWSSGDGRFVSGSHWLEWFQFQIDQTHEALEPGRYLFRATCFGTDGNANEEEVIVNIVNELPQKPQPVFAGTQWEVAQDPNACNAHRPITCPEDQGICCLNPSPLGDSYVCTFIDKTNPLRDEVGKLRCNDPNDITDDDWIYEPRRILCEAEPENYCQPGVHLCCTNERNELACLQGPDGGAPTDSCNILNELNTPQAGGGGQVGGGGGNPNLSSPSKCEIEDMIVYRKTSEWTKIPKGFEIPQIYYNSAEVTAANQKMQKSFTDKGYPPARVTDLTMKGAVDNNHNNNKALGPNEGWLYGTYAELKGRNADGNLDVEFKQGYHNGLGLVVDATLTRDSDPNQCLESQFAKGTIKFSSTNQFNQASFFVGTPPWEPAPAEGRKSFMYKESDIKKDKGLNQLNLPKTWNEASKLKKAYPHDPAFPNNPFCIYENDMFCLDDFLQPATYGGNLRPGSSKDHKKYIIAKSDARSPVGDSIAVIPGSKPHIIWWDNAGGETGIGHIISADRQGLHLPEPLPTDNRGFTDWKGSIIAVVEEPQKRSVQITVNQGQTNEETKTAEYWHRWVCEISDIHMINSFDQATKKRVKTPEGEIKCKCYPQRRGSEAQPWERVPKQGGGGFVENEC